MKLRNLLLVILALLFDACNREDHLKPGAYSIVSASFQEGTPIDVMKCYLQNYSKLNISRDSIILSDSVRLKYYYKNGYIHIIYNNEMKEYECEDFSSEGQSEYAIVIENDIIKQIRIVSVL